MIKFAACRVLYQPKTPNRKRCHLQDWEEGSLRDTVVEYLRPSTLHIVSHERRSGERERSVNGVAEWCSRSNCMEHPSIVVVC